MYCIVDIETTGGKYNEEGITEIAIYKFNGQEIVDQFISLINPEIPIQPFVEKLTGINNAMLKNAPKFYELAKRIVEITENTILVAHNASFDYRILQTEFKRLGYPFKKQTLCTVELSKRLLPNQKSYSLGKLVRGLGIPITDRHRASGDAMATVKLFKLLLSQDAKKEIIKTFIKTEISSGLTPKLLHLVESLPREIGVFYFHNEHGDIIYIGKSKNIQKRVTQHFTKPTAQNIKIQNEVFEVSYEKTGNELIAQLKEDEEIKLLLPKYNRKQSKSKWALYANKNNNGKTVLEIQKTDKRKREIMLFSNASEGKRVLDKIIEKYELQQKLTVQSEHNYNAKITEIITKNSLQNKNLILIGKGRTVSEKSAVLIENGSYKGYCFFNLNFQITSIAILKNLITPKLNNFDSKAIIQKHIRQNKVTIRVF